MKAKHLHPLSPVPPLIFIAVLLSFLLGCSSPGAKDLSEILPGNWLIVFPDHQLRSPEERKAYGKYQDSIVGLYGLKLLSFKENGEFVEMDSLLKTPAKWTARQDGQLTIREGGKGFNPFKTNFEEYSNDTLRMVQYLSLDDEQIKLVWHLKKISADSEEAKLFSSEANHWRKKPTAPEPDLAIRKRLVNLLNYYSDYFKLVSKESSYFLVSRVPLPFRYYQHAIGLREMQPSFTNIFYNEDDAKKAYMILEQTINALANKFDWNENFVVEYGLSLKKMANWITDY